MIRKIPNNFQVIKLMKIQSKQMSTGDTRDGLLDEQEGDARRFGLPEHFACRQQRHQDLRLRTGQGHVQEQHLPEEVKRTASDQVDGRGVLERQIIFDSSKLLLFTRY